MPATLTLTRRGSFQVRHVEHDALQCGVRGTRKFFFRVEVECPETALDSRGFLVDQFDILRLMQSRYGSAYVIPSCELLAIDACHAVADLCPGAQNVKVTIGTGPRAYMTAELPLQQEVA